MKKSNAYLLVCLIVVVIAFVPTTRNFLVRIGVKAVRPIESFFSSLSFSSRGFFYGLSQISDLREQNRELSDKLRQSQISQSELEELKAENQILKKQLGFKEVIKERDLIPSKIISREPTTFLDNMIIDKGEKDGIRAGLAVVSDGALVGKVTEVYSNESKVTLITSKDSIIQAMMQKSRVMGILKGGLSGMTLENIPQDVEVAEREVVMTSGLGGGIDQGILIGEISGQRSSKAEIYKVLNVQPTVDFSKLEIVFVIK